MDVPTSYTVPVISGILFYILLPRIHRLILGMRRVTKKIYWVTKDLSYKLSRIQPHKAYDRYPKRRTYRRVSRQSLARYLNKNVVQKYEPWISDYVKAGLGVGSGLVWLCFALFIYSKYPAFYVLILAMMAVVPFYYASIYHDSALSRKRGKIVEQRSKNQFIKMMPKDWSVISLKLLSGIGDIDLPIRLDDNNICLIEIKSWRHWKGYGRKKHALLQVRRQKYATRASCIVIWLPEAEASFVIYDKEVCVIGGNAISVIRKIPDLIRYHVVIKFVQKPSDDMLFYIKRTLRFQWSAKDICWKGRCSLKERDEIAAQVQSEGGSIFISDDKSR